jgi:uncharacterized protein GlcG (DUF336 family)
MDKRKPELRSVEQRGMKMSVEAGSRPMLTDSGATRIVESAIAAAKSRGVPVTVVVVDDGGNLKALRRMDGAPLVSIQTAQNKAYAAAAIGMPVDEFFEAIKGDAAAVASFASRPGLALIAGGVPLVEQGQVLGGVGVAGAMTGAEDRAIAEAGVRVKDASNRDTNEVGFR